MSFRLIFFAALLLLATGCSTKELVYYEIPRELQDPVIKSEFLKRYTPYLQGKKFFLDPGHGGSDRRSIGRLKLVTEADVNLYVALALKDYLIEAGAVVLMSRVTDTTVDLKERSVMANSSGADFFISIHHNAPGQENDNWTNYTSTYYHATEKDYEYEPSERDLARYIQRDLAYSMRNSGGLGSFDGTYSDYWIYPNAGFSVLRLTEIPSVLVECGFFTNNFEERRLALNEFNRIQAWGIFRGIARYLSAGIPEIIFLGEEEIYQQNPVVLNFLLRDSTGIDTTTIKIQVDSIEVKEYSFDRSSNLLSVNLTEIKPGDHMIRVILANKNRNYALPFHKKITVRLN
jgi:N-acetylmuramoyl-L-alanine amidase